MDPKLPSIESIVRQYSPLVRNMAARIVGRTPDVDDVAQEVFLGASLRIHELRQPAALKGWLASVAVRLAYRRLRSQRRHRHEDAESDIEKVAAPGPSAEQWFQLSEGNGILRKLPAEQRSAWILRHVEGCTLPDVAVASAC